MRRMQRESDRLPVSSYTAFDTANDTIWAVRSSHLGKRLSIQTNFKTIYGREESRGPPIHGIRMKIRRFLSIKSRSKSGLPMWQFGYEPLLPYFYAIQSMVKHTT